ncbi:hypothetical protein BSAE_1784 [Bifidobacterium pullorum subsp. saeculare DSM 6531 = LMG 14934]|uniref:Uncharacterized protein n=1 Tax=Bifidobacterium pullorum subsp. saeculare DSM 6531 = LMG 14934 TaxID=1437611 RepID=A0A087CXZ7_9BIFI|nr:hypothetical protein BSAE_1784 [Bifidobacterium pullorum subsp. saeculare DSM 6531 = LMG 14934]
MFQRPLIRCIMWCFDRIIRCNVNLPDGLSIAPGLPDGFGQCSARIFHRVTLLIAHGFQHLLDMLVLLRGEKLLDQVSTVLGFHAQEFGELPLRQHDGFRELITIQPDQLIDLRSHIVGFDRQRRGMPVPLRERKIPCGATIGFRRCRQRSQAVFDLPEFGRGTVRARFTALGHILVFRFSSDAIEHAVEFNDQIHHGDFPALAEESGTHPRLIGVQHRRRPIEREGDAIKDGGFAGAGLPLDQEHV